MKADSESWLSVDDLCHADYPRQAFCGARGRLAAAGAPDEASPPLTEDIGLRWRELVSAAHHGLERCAALLQIDSAPQADAHAFARQIEHGCDRLAPRHAAQTAEALLPRACVLAGLIGRLIRDAYDYANVRVVMGGALIGYQLVCTKLADMVIADEIVELRLSAALDAAPRSHAEAGWRGVPALPAADHLAEIARCAAAVLSLYLQIYAGHAFVQRADSAPVLGVAQSLLDGIQTALPGRA